jgi:hypothetical protein
VAEDDAAGDDWARRGAGRAAIMDGCYRCE